MKAVAGLALSGRYAAPAAQAARGLQAWAAQRDVQLTIQDTGTGDSDIEEFYRRSAVGADLLFGPYGSGPLRAAERGLEGLSAVLWNHGGAAPAAERGPRVVDVLGPATRYWSGLAAVLDQRDIGLDRVAIVHAETPFGRDTASGARRSLAAAGAEPLLESRFDVSTAPTVVRSARARGARCIVGCGRIEDDLALVAEAYDAGVPVGAIVAGVSLAQEALGPAVLGSFGPAQWFADTATPLGPGADYPAAQAYAAGQVSIAAYERAGSSDPSRLWDAVRSLRCQTIIGRFEIDAHGRQITHSPLIVEWVATAAGARRRVIWRP